MALTSATNKITYNGDGSTTAFAFPYLVYDSTHVQVYVNAALQTTGYTVSGVGDASGVTITFTPAPALNANITLQRVVPLTQLAIYDVAGAFPAKTTEKNFDLSVMRAQQHETARLRSLRQADGDGADVSTLPLLAARANKYLAFDSSGNPIATDAATASGTSVLTTGTDTARLLADRFTDFANAKDFGVVADGVTDDTTNLQQQVTTGRATLPVGTIKVSAAITFDDDVTIQGSGVGKTIIKGALATALLKSVNTAARKYRVTIRDLTIDNTDRATAGGIGLDLTNVTMAHIENVVIQNVATGVKLNGTGGGCFYNELYNVRILVTTTGYLITELANENHIYGGRVNNATICVDIDNNAGNDFYGTAIEAFSSTGVRIANSAVVQYTNLIGMRFENTPTVGTGISLSANAQTTAIITPMFVGLTTNVSDSGVDTQLLAADRTAPAFRLNKLKLSNTSYGTAVGAQVYSDTNERVLFRGPTDSTYADVRLRKMEMFGALAPGLTLASYGTTIAIDASLGNNFRITATDGVGFTVSNPTNATSGQELMIMVRNTSGGALGTLTWSALFKLGAAWTQPANGNSRSIHFLYDGTNWVEVARTAADVSN